MVVRSFPKYECIFLTFLILTSVPSDADHHKYKHPHDKIFMVILIFIENKNSVYIPDLKNNIVHDGKVATFMYYFTI